MHTLSRYQVTPWIPWNPSLASWEKGGCMKSGCAHSLKIFARLIYPVLNWCYIFHLGDCLALSKWCKLMERSVGGKRELVGIWNDDREKGHITQRQIQRQIQWQWQWQMQIQNQIQEKTKTKIRSERESWLVFGTMTARKVIQSYVRENHAHRHLRNATSLSSTGH